MTRLFLLLALLVSSSAFGQGNFQGVGRSLRDSAYLAAPDYETGSFNVSMSGPRSTTAVVYFVRIGKLVTISVAQNLNASCVTSSNFTSASGAFPAKIRPARQHDMIIVGIMDNAAPASQNGDAVIGTDGLFRIFKTIDSDNFTSGANCGWYAFTASYPLI